MEVLLASSGCSLKMHLRASYYEDLGRTNLNSTSTSTGGGGAVAEVTVSSHHSTLPLRVNIFHENQLIM